MKFFVALRLCVIILLFAGCGTGSTVIESPGGRERVTIVRGDVIHFIGWASGIDCVTEYPYIYVRSGRDPDLAELAHEELHAERQFEMGYAKWEAKYKSDEAFRLQEELLGYRVQLDGDAPDPGVRSQAQETPGPAYDAWVAADQKREELAFGLAFNILSYYGLHGLTADGVVNELLALPSSTSAVALR